MDSLDANVKTGGETGNGTRLQRSPANGYFLTGFGLAMIAGGTAIADAGEKRADRCREEDSILKICDDGSYLSAPVIGIGILSLVFGVVSLFEAYRTE